MYLSTVFPSNFGQIDFKQDRKFFSGWLSRVKDTGCWHSHKKRKNNLEVSLNRVLSATELESPKILVPRLPQHESNVNIECARKSKHLHSLCDQLFGALIINLFLINDASYMLCNIWLLCENNSRGITLQELNTEEKILLQLLLEIGW